MEGRKIEAARYLLRVEPRKANASALREAAELLGVDIAGCRSKESVIERARETASEFEKKWKADRLAESIAEARASFRAKIERRIESRREKVAAWSDRFVADVYSVFHAERIPLDEIAEIEVLREVAAIYDYGVEAGKEPGEIIQHIYDRFVYLALTGAAQISNRSTSARGNLLADHLLAARADFVRSFDLGGYGIRTIRP